MFHKSGLILNLFWIIRITNGNTQNFTTRSLSASQFGNTTYMDMLSRKVMQKMHDELDNDDDGNVSISEGVEFIAGNKDLVKIGGENANLPAFGTDVDGRITEAEFWESWINSHVHNWTNGEMLSWLQYDAEMPQYATNFQALNITGAAFPILACNGSVVSSLVDGSKENKLKLMLKAKEIVLFGPSKPKSNWLKDALLTFSFALALSGIAFGVHVQRNANRTILSIQEKMKALQSSMDKMEEEAELEWPRDVSRQDDERSAGSNSGDSEDSLGTNFSLTDDIAARERLAEVMRDLDRTKEALRNAEKRLQKMSQSFDLPPELLNCLQMTYQMETKLFEMKKKQVYKNVDQTKAQFQKIEKNRTSFFGVLQVVHSRQVDSFDYQVQQTRDDFRELQSIMKERRRRWATMEQLCHSRIVPTSLRRGSGTSSRITVRSSEEEILTNMLEMAPSSSSTSNDKGKGSKNKRFTAISPISHKAPAMPTHSSSPALSTLNGHGYDLKKKVSSKLAHSESTKQLPSGSPLLSIPEGANQTFPRRSPNAKKRQPFPSDFVSESPEEITAQDNASKSAQPVVQNGEQASKLSPLDGTKRSISAQSLPQIQDGNVSPVLAPTQNAKLIASSSGSIDSDGSSETTGGTPSISSLDTSRKSNLKKRVFNILQRKKKTKTSE